MIQQALIDMENMFDLLKEKKEVNKMYLISEDFLRMHLDKIRNCDKLFIIIFHIYTVISL